MNAWLEPLTSSVPISRETEQAWGHSECPLLPARAGASPADSAARAREEAGQKVRHEVSHEAGESRPFSYPVIRYSVKNDTKSCNP
jgi:hypothetical protein